jgi:hypothetical protein
MILHTIFVMMLSTDSVFGLDVELMYNPSYVNLLLFIPSIKDLKGPVTHLNTLRTSSSHVPVSFLMCPDTKLGRNCIFGDNWAILNIYG